MRQLTFGSLFAGVGGFDAGFDAAGMKCVYQCELDAQCRGVLARHYPETERGVDVNDDQTAADLVRLRPDWVTFGFPCQDLSVAGRRAGLAGKRSGLFFRSVDLIAACRPVGFCCENVPGLLSSNERRDMGAVLRSLGNLGYWWAYRVFDAQWFGVAQRRRRVFIVGHLRKRRAAEILFEREGLPWDSPPSREAWSGVANAVTRGLGSGGADDNKAQGGHLVAFGGNNTSGAIEVATACNAHGGPCRIDFESETFIAHTLRAQGFESESSYAHQYRQDSINSINGVADAICCSRSRMSQGYHVPSGVRRLTPRECERLQGFADNWTQYTADGKELADGPRYRMLGNAVNRNVAEWLGRRIVAAEGSE